MYRDEFKTRYTSIPFATFERNHKKDEENDIITLLHNHREIEIIVILDGSANMSINGNSYTLSKNDIVIIPPYALHSTKILKKFDFKHFCMCFDLSLLNEISLKTRLETGETAPNCVIKEDEKGHDEIIKILKTVYRMYEEKTAGWELEIKGYLCVFFGMLFKNEKIKSVVSSKENDVSRIVLDFIEKNYKEKLTSKDMAKMLYVSESWFCKTFKKNFGFCFQNYLCMYRIEKAKILLTTSQKTISEISVETGFQSFSFFGKMFKAYIGVTPSQYRKISTY